MNDALDAACGLRSHWQELGLVETELQVDAGGTVVQGVQSVAPTVSWSAVVGRLPRVETEDGLVVALGAELGRGGMGLVRCGNQRSLDREVAVKTTLDRASVSATQALLREAWITGQLEHPNVIPIHALYRDDSAPLLVMKRVEGKAWSAVLREGGPLERHLRIHAQVCHAVHFAHTRGFVHLDVKPENVMIGEYGEIYLLDWGIAACIREDMPEFIPRARQIKGVLGTPAYMAPELAAADGTIDARTDVYLLGAVLYEILTGRPPHLAQTLMMSIVSAYESAEPEWPADVPDELAAIANRALRRDAEERFSSAAELREALEDYLVHADSLSLSAAARGSFDQVLRALDRNDEQREIDRLAGEAEFGFRQALHVWPENRGARALLQDLLERLIERDLAEEKWELAARRLAGLPLPRPDLEARIDAMKQARTRAADELHRLREDADLGKAASQRRLLAYTGVLGWTSLIVGLGVANRLDLMRATHAHMFSITAFAVVLFIGIVYRYRSAMFANTINRDLVALLALGWFFGVVYWAAAWRVGAPFEAAVVGIGPLIAFVVAAGAATVDRRLLWPAIGAVLGMTIQILLPAWGLEILGVTGGVILFMMGRIWGSAPSTGATRGQPRPRVD